LSAAVRFEASPLALAGQHAPGLGNLEIGVADQRIVRRVPLRFLDIAGPFCVAIHRIDAQPDDPHAALVELGLDARHVAQLGGADGREILGVRKQHRPGGADPVMETDMAFGRLSFEIRSGVSERENHVRTSQAFKHKVLPCARSQAATATHRCERFTPPLFAWNVAKWYHPKACAR
jgi:hypothetical protein